MHAMYIVYLCYIIAVHIRRKKWYANNLLQTYVTSYKLGKLYHLTMPSLQVAACISPPKL